MLIYTIKSFNIKKDILFLIFFKKIIIKNLIFLFSLNQIFSYMIFMFLHAKYKKYVIPIFLKKNEYYKNKNISVDDIVDV